jgi:tetraacyldisaccharide 4'-kinase
LRQLATGQVLSLDEFIRMPASRGRIVALAGIARPDRFFAMLASMGLQARSLPLGDHARLEGAEFPSVDADLIVMTEKDAVKSGTCADPRCWSLIVEARLPGAFIDWLLERLNGQPTA